MIYCGVESRNRRLIECESKPAFRLPRLVLVGTCNPGKGQLVAIRALKHLIDQQVKAELVLVGPTTNAAYLDELKRNVIEFGLDEYISFVGYKDDPTSIVAEADLVLMCSRSEAFGLVTVEGMKEGKAVVGARAGATSELIRDGFNGLLYTLDDPEDLAAKVRYLLENPDLAKQMGENGRRWADETFSVNGYTREVLGVLNDASKRTR
jgi:glycosyltransferase involved in cell wall biosynthesis